MGRLDVDQVDFVSGVTWQLTGTFVDNTGSFTGLDCDTNAKIVQRGIDTSGRVVFDRYKITGIVSQDANNLVVKIVSDFPTGIQNRDLMPYTGAFPISLPYNDSSSLTYRAAFGMCGIDPDYDAALDNLNLLETLSWPDTINSVATKYDVDTTYSKKYKIEISSDSENNLTVPFTLKSTSTVYYNGFVLKDQQWSGINSKILVLNFATGKYSYVYILN